MKGVSLRATRFACVAMSAAFVTGSALAIVPFYGNGTATPPPPADPYDYASYLFIKNGDCSTGTGGPDLQRAGFDCKEFKYTDWREPPGPSETYDPSVANNPQELYGVRGAATNRAWMVSTGRPDVLISVLDSGIQWQNQGDMRPLANKLFINRGELPKPTCANGQTGNAADTRFDGYDCDGNGVFNVADYARDGRVGDRNGNGVLDPEDLIFTFSDGTDGDNNGYVDDISGWDFFENDNDPRDEVVYGHGTGEAKDSSAEAGFDDGQCPNCMVIPLRVGDSFVADVNHFAEAVVYSVDIGVNVVQEAEGDYNMTSFGQAAIDYAYSHGVIVNASEADENASHHMWPAAYDKTMVVNSYHAANVAPAARPYSFLYFNACTNFGVYTYLAIPSNSCSSEATGRSSGISGLLQSAARNAVERGQMTRYIDDSGAQKPWPLSVEELRQLWRLGADDIDFASPCAGGVGPHAGCGKAPPGVIANAPPDNYVTTIPGAARYETVKGWDFFSGYGRANNGRSLRFIGLQGIPGFDDQIEGPASLTAQDRIPPEAWIETPRWFRQYGYRPDGTLLIPDDPLQPNEMVVTGHVAANRVTAAGGTFDYVVEWAPQVQGPNFAMGGGLDRSAPGSEEKSDGPWTIIGSGNGLRRAKNGVLARVDVRSIAGIQGGSLNPFNPVTDPTSPFFPELSDIRLRVRVIAHPKNTADTINNEAVSQKSVDVYAAAETIMRDDLGLRGKPSDGGASPTFHDVDGDGVDELVLATGDGLVHAYTDVAKGLELAGWPVRTIPLAAPGLHGVANGGDVSYPDIHASGDNAYTRGDVPSDFLSTILIATPAVVDLDDDGEVEVLTSDNEGHVYAWEPDGSPRAGFPVTVNYDWTTPVRCGPTTIPNCDAHVGAAQLKRDEFNRKDWGVISGVSVGDLDPAHPGLEIVAGASDGHLYVWHEDGSRMLGWPVMLRDPTKLASVDPLTHFLRHTETSGVKYDVAILPTPSLGDIDGDGVLDVVSGVDEEYVETPNAAFDPATLVAAQVLGSAGNNRVYALYHDGNRHPQSAGTLATVHPDDQAYLPGWPAKPAMLLTELLPTVGSGTNTQPLIFPGSGGPNIGVSSCCGPVYVLNAVGKSIYGQDGNGNDITLADTVKGAQSTAVDMPAIAGVGGLAVGSLDGGLHLSVIGPGTGLRRALSVAAVDEHSLGAEDHLSMWDVRTGQHEPNSPIQVNDLQFFTHPIVADLDGLGLASAIQSTAVGDTVGATLASTEFANVKRYHTGGWIVASAAVGAGPVRTQDGSSDNRLYMATITREGYLRLYQTPMAAGSSAGCTALKEWPEKGHDARRSGNYSTDGERPYPVRNANIVRAADGGLTLHFLATGDDRFCGRASKYEVRAENPSAPGNWKSAALVPTSSKNGDPGAEIVEPLPALAANVRTLLVRAYDESNNGSAIAAVDVPTGPTPPPATIAVSVPQPITITVGSTTPGTTTVTLSNPGGTAALVDSMSLQVTDPQDFAKIVVTAPDGRAVTITNPTSTPVFNFTPAVSIAARGTGAFNFEFDMRPQATARSQPLLVKSAFADSGASHGNGPLSVMVLILCVMLLLPRRTAVPIVLALAFLGGCNNHTDQETSAQPCTVNCGGNTGGGGNGGGGGGGSGGGGGGNGGGGGGGGTSQGGTVTLQSVAVHGADGSVIVPSGVPVRLANVTP